MRPEAEVADFADIIKIPVIFIKITFKNSIKIERPTN